MLLHIDTLDTKPIYEQLRNQIVIGIARRHLKTGDPLPSVRRLAADLGINFHTVNKSYAALCDEGYINMDRRKGAVIANIQGADADFSGGLAQRLVLNAAEAVCHGISDAEFAQMCAAAYQNAVSCEKEEE